MEVDTDKDFLLIQDNGDGSCTFTAQVNGRKEVEVVPSSFAQLVGMVVAAPPEASVQAVNSLIFEESVNIPNEMET